MKKILFFIIGFQFILQTTFSQEIFPTPDGPPGTLSSKTKHVSYYVKHECWSLLTLTTLRKKKDPSKNMFNIIEKNIAISPYASDV